MELTNEELMLLDDPKELHERLASIEALGYGLHTLEPLFKGEIPELGKLSRGELLEQLGLLKDMQEAITKPLDKLEKLLKETLKAGLSKKEATTGINYGYHDYCMSITSSSQVRFDAEKLHAKYDDDSEWLAKYTKTSDVLTIRISGVPKEEME